MLGLLVAGLGSAVLLGLRPSGLVPNEGGLEIADRVGMLEGGFLRFVGTPEEFRQCPDPVVRAFVDRKAAEAALDMMSGIR